MMRNSPGLIAAAALGLVAALPSVADACSPPICALSLAAPANGTSIPVSAPALYARPAQYMGLFVDHSATIQLATLAGTAVPFTLERELNSSPPAWFVRPNEGLSPGATYRLTFVQDCDQSGLPAQDGGVPVTTSTFTVTSFSPLPKSSGWLVADIHEDSAFRVATASGSCTAEATGTEVTLSLDQNRSGALDYLAVAKFITTVDGKPWAATAYGEAFEAGGVGQFGGRRANHLYGVCGNRDPLNDNGLLPGEHHVTVQLHVAGATSDPPPAEAYVTLTCPSLPAGDDIPSPLDGFVPSDANGLGATSHGCTMSGAVGGVPVMLVVLGLAVLMTLRRRRG